MLKNRQKIKAISSHINDKKPLIAFFLNLSKILHFWHANC